MVCKRQHTTKRVRFTVQNIRILLGILVIVGMASLPGCSKTQGAGETKPVVKACTLVTQAEMEAIFGRPMKTPEEKSYQTTSTCNYVSAEETETFDDVKNMISFTLLVSPLENRKTTEAYTQYVAEVKKELNVEMKAVDGLGEKAGWSEEVKQLTIFKGKMMLVISGVPAKAATLELNRQIAEKALTRWPK